MKTALWFVLAAMLSSVTLTGCGPLLGAAGAVAADEVVEDDKGGDGLF